MTIQQLVQLIHEAHKSDDNAPCDVIAGTLLVYYSIGIHRFCVDASLRVLDVVGGKVGWSGRARDEEEILKKYAVETRKEN